MSTSTHFLPRILHHSKVALKHPVTFFLLTMSILLGWDASHLEASDTHGHFVISQGRIVLVAVLALMFIAGVLYSSHRHERILPECRRMWLLLAFSVLASFAFNIEMHQAVPLLFVPVISLMGTFCLSWAMLGRFALIFWLPLFAFDCLTMWVYYEYGVPTNNAYILSELLDASLSDLLALVNFPFIIAVILSAILLATLAYACLWLMRGARRPALMNMGCISLLLSGIATYIPRADEPWVYPLYPLQEIRTLKKNVNDALFFNQYQMEYLQALPSPAAKGTSMAPLTDKDGLVVILHIGESVRADRMGLNGYRNQGTSTTPWLDSQKGKSLINFSSCISSDGVTSGALITVLTDARRAPSRKQKPEFNARAGSVLDLFQANRFATHSFLQPLSMSGKYDKVMRLLLGKQTQIHYSPDKLPHTALPDITRILREQPNQNILLLINNQGSHVPFDAYDASSTPFRPLPPRTSVSPHSHAQELNNAYDSTIHYTDRYIQQVVESLKGRPFVYIYVSDHGEYLGHDGTWFRNGATREYHSTTACQVGMFIITSPEFESLHPRFAGAVQQLKAHADMIVGHEHIYHTLLGLVGIQTPYYNPELDLSAPSAVPYTGPMPDMQEAGTP